MIWKMSHFLLKEAIAKSGDVEINNNSFRGFSLRKQHTWGKQNKSPVIDRRSEGSVRVESP